MVAGWWHAGWRRRGFSLVEIAAVTVVVGVMLAAASSLWKPVRGRSRELAVDQICAAVDRARHAAAARRERVMLAWAEPTDDAPAAMRMGWFRVLGGPDRNGVFKVAALQRWQVLPDGVVLLPERSGTLRNVMDAPVWRLQQPGREELEVHGIVIDPQGRMIAPAGNDVLMLRVAEGVDRNGCIVADGSAGNVHESKLRIGRSLARPVRESW